MRKTDILEVTSRKLAPFILMFGFYVVSYGHLSPGGGFQGGVVLASAIVLLFLCHDTELIKRYIPVRIFIIIEASAFMLFLIMGMLGLFLEGHFMAIFLPVVRDGEIPAASYILIMNFIIGLKVGAGISLICYYLFRKD